MAEDVELRAAWEGLLDRLREAGEVVLGDHGATDDTEAAEGFRFLTRLASAAFDMFVEHGDTARPSFVRLMTDHRKFYGDNPDTFYDWAAVRGRRRYRITGERGTAEYLACCVYGRDAEGRTRIIANVSDRDFPVDDHGRFRLHLSMDPPSSPEDGHWVPLEADADAVIIRQYFLDRRTERPATYDIECLDQPGPPPNPTPAHLARRLGAVGDFVATGALFSAALAHGLAQQPNEPTIDSEASKVAAFYPTPDNRYTGGWFSLGEDEVLVVEGTPPASRYWSLLLMSRWMESLDARHRTTILNKSQVTLEPDGSFRILVSHRDPGSPNWLDTAGHRQGYVLFRWMQVEDVAAPSFRVERLGD